MSICVLGRKRGIHYLYSFWCVCGINQRQADLGSLLRYPPYNIPEGDFLLSVVPRIDAIRLGLRRIDLSDLRTALSPLVKAAYLLWTDVTRESSCDVQDCIDTREIIKQAYFRLVRLSRGELSSYEDQILELGKLQYIYTGLYIGTSWVMNMYRSACLRTADQYTESTTTAESTHVSTESAETSTVVVSSSMEAPSSNPGCWSTCVANCVRRFVRTTTTTNPPTTVPITLSPDKLRRREAVRDLIRSTSNELDTLIFNIGVAIALNDPVLSLDVRQQSRADLDRMVKQTIVPPPADYNTTNLAAIPHRVVDDWSVLLLQISDLRSEIRN